MLAIIKSRRGETLIEVLVATIVLIVGALASARLFAIATVNNDLTKERVIATNLAREGLEAVRVIRDTNWLRFAGDRRTCWNNLDPSECVDSGGGYSIDPIRHRQQYVARFDPNNYRWELQSAGLGGRLDLYDGVGDSDADYQLKIDANGLYNQFSNGADTPFYREIYTEYLNDDQTQDALTTEANNILRVTSIVEWYDRGKINNVTLTTILTDYLGRKDHN
ncbi:MAG: hypothetical protein V2A63_01695 [Patescibacteria group bacterium]